MAGSVDQAADEADLGRYVHSSKTCDPGDLSAARLRIPPKTTSSYVLAQASPDLGRRGCTWMPRSLAWECTAPESKASDGRNGSPMILLMLQLFG